MIYRRPGSCVAAACLLFTAVLDAQDTVPKTQSPDILAYIRQTWQVLTRSNGNLATAAVDPKFKPGPDGRWPLYVPQSDDLQLVEAGLRKDLPAAAFKTIDLIPLPADLDQLKVQGLLYLPHPYVVPGGRFNEMYGWDSYFIQVGLLRDGETELAKNLADNFLYEVKNYGQVLNANRSYYLTRSQPPFLTQLVWGVYETTHDRAWLEAALPMIEKYYGIWSRVPHLTAETGLARYYDLGEGPAPEVLSAEKDAEGRNHYQLVKEFFKTHQFDDYDVNQYYDRATDELKPLFYKGDRSMRESGFDPSNRFGPFNIDVIHYNPVCLNSLLYLMETQTGAIQKELGHNGEAAKWAGLAQARAGLVNKLMWDDKDGLYYDYNFATRQLRRYPFLTTFYPLWAGIASKQQAERVRLNLSKFERPGGLQTSTYVSGNQWDSPFGWAPLQMIAEEGLRRYGFHADAERVSSEFLSLVYREFLRQGFIVEKYNVVSSDSNVSSQIHFGYSANQAGFGWTNAVFTQLYDEMSPGARKKLLKAP